MRRRLALGSVQELTLARAHELAGAQRHHIRQTGEDPRARRHSCMLLSNRLKPDLKTFLTKQDEWWKLRREDLVKLGLTGKTVELAYAAGLSATEQTMGNASKAVARANARRLARPGGSPRWHTTPF